MQSYLEIISRALNPTDIFLLQKHNSQSHAYRIASTHILNLKFQMMKWAYRCR